MNKHIAAALSYLAYNPIAGLNDIQRPIGWQRDDSLSNGWDLPQNERSGFGAHVYVEGDPTSPSQVVIAFRGTEDGGAAVMDWLNNFALASGFPAPQLTAAIDRYLEVRKKYPDAEIAFTGHSLGGGLASLVAMLFGHEAKTFAQAPFEFGIFNPLIAAVVKNRLSAAGIADSDPIAQRFYDFYFTAPEDPDAEPDFQRSQYAIRQDAIEVYAITGEIVSQRLPLSIFPDAAGSWTPLDINGTDLTTPILGAIDRHSMALHMAGVMSEEFREASRTVSTLLPLMFDEGLYPTKVTSSEQTFLAGLLRKHIEETLPTYGTGDGALKRFSQQALLLADIAGVAEDSELEQGLVMLLMQHYRESGYAGADLFVDLDDGIRFDVSQITLDQAGRGIIALNDSRNAGFLNLFSQGELWKFIANNTSNASKRFEGEIRSASDLDGFNNWFVSKNVEENGTVTAFHETGTDGQDVMIGSDRTADYLAGGNGTDLLIGLEGDDVLDGGDGNDHLYGGAGQDTYLFGSGHGTDHIVDRDGGVLMLDGRQLSGGISVLSARGGTRIWRDADSGVLYVFERLNSDEDTGDETGNLTIYTAGLASEQQKIVIHDWKYRTYYNTGSFGLSFTDAPKVSISAGVRTANSFSDSDWAPPEGVTVSLAEGGHQTLTLSLSSVASESRTIRLSTSDDLGFEVVLGDAIIPMGTGGVDVFVPAGESQVIVGLRQTADIDAVRTAVLTASSIGGDGGVVSTHALTLSFQGSVESATTNHVVGDGGSVIGTAGNDLIEAMVFEQGAAARFINGSDGDDVIFALAEDDEQTLIDAGELAASVQQGTTYYAHVEGGNGNDRIFGSNGNDYVYAGAGADLIVGGGGDDYILGDDALTTIEKARAGGDDDLIYGGAGNDFLFGERGDDVLHGGAGDDRLRGGLGSDALFGGDGNDDLSGDSGETIWGQPSLAEVFLLHGDDFLDGGAGDDLLSGGGGNDALFGGDGNDVIRGGSREGPRLDPVTWNYFEMPSAQWDAQYPTDDDYLDGEGGDDWLYGGVGNDLLLGGEGADVLYGDYPDATLDHQGDDTLYGEDGDDLLYGFGGDDYLDGGAGVDRLDAGDGNDTLLGGSGNDLLIGGLGEDHLEGGADDDILFGDGSTAAGTPDFVAGGDDWLDGGAGNDTLNGQGGDDILLGGSGHDRLAGDAGSDRIYGGSGDDVIAGDNAVSGLPLEFHGADFIDGGDGDDILYGNGGDDEIHGGEGNDELSGGVGDDFLDGGAGNDVYFFETGDGIDVVRDAGGMDAFVFGSGLSVDDLSISFGVLKFQGKDLEIHVGAEGFNGLEDPVIESFVFTGSGETFSLAELVSVRGMEVAADGAAEGTDANERFQGSDDGDIIMAGGGFDSVSAGAGNDYVDGGAGDDWIDGGAGNDYLFGGEGNDTYLFTEGGGVDLIQDGDGDNTIHFADGIAFQELSVTQEDGDVHIVRGADRMIIRDWDGNDTRQWSITWAGGLVDLFEHFNNGIPTVVDDAAYTSEDSFAALSGNVLANDSDPTGEPLHVINPGTYTGQYGTLQLAADGAWQYTRNTAISLQWLTAGESVTDSFTYTVSDGARSATHEVKSIMDIVVYGMNDVPVKRYSDLYFSQNISMHLGIPPSIYDGGYYSFLIVPSFFHDAEDGQQLAMTITLSDGVTKPDWIHIEPSIEVQEIIQDYNGVQPIPVVAYIMPDDSAVGTNFLRLYAIDSDGNSVYYSFTLNVINVNDWPIAHADTLHLQEDGVASITFQTLLANDTDEDIGDTLTVVSVSPQSAQGMALTVDQGVVTYDPAGAYDFLAEGQTATDTFTYQVADRAGAQATGQVTVTITGQNDAPVVVMPQQAITVDDEEAFSFAFSPDVFADVDQGDVLDYSLTLTDGQPLPDWLSFDPVTLTISGHTHKVIFPPNDGHRNYAIFLASNCSGLI